MAEFLKQYQILFKKAKVDLNSSKVILESFQKGSIELDLEVIFFHLQQASEKLIKALLDLNKTKFPHTHDLQLLHQLLLDKNIDFPANVEELLPLSEYSVEGRYSIINDDLESVDKYIEIISDFRDFVESLL